MRERTVLVPEQTARRRIVEENRVRIRHFQLHPAQRVTRTRLLDDGDPAIRAARRGIAIGARPCGVAENALAQPFAYDDREKSALEPYLRPEESERWPVLDWARDALGDPAQPRATISFLTDLNMAIHRRIAYERRDEEGTQTANETLARGRGSCRDMAGSSRAS